MSAFKRIGARRPLSEYRSRNIKLGCHTVTLDPKLPSAANHMTLQIGGAFPHFSPAEAGRPGRAAVPTRGGSVNTMEGTSRSSFSGSRGPTLKRVCFRVYSIVCISKKFEGDARMCLHLRLSKCSIDTTGQLISSVSAGTTFASIAVSRLCTEAQAALS
jgi:hypothetical protein